MQVDHDSVQGGAVVRGMDMTDERDRGLLRRALAGHLSGNKRWGGVSDETKVSFVSALKYALKLAIGAEDHRSIRGIVATLATLEGQNQADEHKLWDVEAKGIPTTQYSLNVEVPLNDDAGRTRLRAIAARLGARMVSVDATGTGSVVGVEYARGQHTNGHAGGLGGDGGAGTLDAGPAPRPDQPSGNGSHHGNGTADPNR